MALPSLCCVAWLFCCLVSIWRLPLCGAQWGNEEKVVIPINDLPLTPANEIQFVEGYFAGEGYIDLTRLEFRTPPSPPPPSSSSSQPVLPSTTTTTTTSIDVAVVRVPDEVCSTPPATLADVTIQCPKSKWMEHLGIGMSTTTGGWWWCCNDGMKRGACHPKAAITDVPHLMVDEALMDGTRRHMELPPDSNTTITPPENAQFVVSEKGGYFVILMASCDEKQGLDLMIDGEVVFVSLEAELKQMIDEDAVFYVIVSIAYLCLFFWFAFLMHENKDSRIPLEEWIFCTIAVGFAEVLLRSIEYIAWFKTSARNPVLAFLAAVAYGAKHGISRGLLVLLCAGVGVSRPSLGHCAATALVFMTVAYVALSVSYNYLTFWEEQRAHDIQGIVYEEGDSMAEILWYLLVGTFLIDIIFLAWIPISLWRTIIHLRASGQERKLLRFKYLFRILWSCAALSLLVFMAFLIDVLYDEGKQASKLNLAQVNEVNVFVILLLVSILWRPNPMAREYAFVMEAPMDENDLELTESSSTQIPTSPNADFKSFPIDSAEAT